jgi:hypothetical protein
MTVYDPALGVSGGTKVLRFASSGYVTSPTAAPANTYYDARIIQAIDATRTLFNGGAAASTPDASQDETAITLGDLILANGDGGLDDLIGYAIDGQSIVEYRSTVFNPQYPADFVKCFVGTMLAAEFATDTITVQMRDMTPPLALPLQTNKYLGNNVLPNGLEGVAADLLGKEKPLVFGSVTNISPPCVNTDKLIYQVSDGAIASVSDVYDKGVSLLLGINFPTTAASASGTYLVGAFGGGVFIVGGNGLVYSIDNGQTWLVPSQPAATGYASVIAGSGGVAFVAGSGVGDIVASNSGLTAWTVRATPFTFSVTGLAFGAGIYVASDGSAVKTSTDLVTWTARSATPGKAACYGALFVMVGTGGSISTSPDGVTWTAQASGVTADLTAVFYGNGVYVAVGKSGTIITSLDGVTWTTRTSGTTVDLGAGVYASPYYMVGATSSNGSLRLSTDAGVTWTGRVGGLSAFGLAAGNSTVVVASNSVVSTSVGAGTYGSIAALLDDTQAPAPGTFKYLSSSSGSYIRLGESAVGTITADVTQGAAPANRTAAQLFTQLLTRAGYSAANWSAADVTALDIAAPYVLGGYYDSATTYIAVLDAIAASVGAWWGPDQFGIFRIQQLTAPVAPAVISFGVNDVVKPITIGVSTGGSNNTGAASTVDGLPVYRCTVNWGQSYTVQTTDLATGVSAARRAVVAQQWRTAQASDLTVITGDPLASETIEDSMLTTAADAQTEASRRLALRKVQRRPFEVTVPFTPETAVVDLGTVIEVVTPRYGLQAAESDGAGALLRVLGVAANAKDSTLAITAWGRGQAARKLIADDGDFLVSDDGVYLVSAVEN